MGYYEILNILMKQLDNINSEAEYLQKQKDIALQTKDIAKELEINVRSVRNHIKQLLKKGEIECLNGDEDITEKYYVMKIDKVRTNENNIHINIVMDCNRDVKSSDAGMGEKKGIEEPKNPSTTL